MTSYSDGGPTQVPVKEYLVEMGTKSHVVQWVSPYEYRTADKITLVRTDGSLEIVKNKYGAVGQIAECVK